MYTSYAAVEDMKFHRDSNAEREKTSEKHIHSRFISQHKIAPTHNTNDANETQCIN